MAEVWQRCDKDCVFRTPDGHESDDLPPPRVKKGVGEAGRNKPINRVYDAIPKAASPCLQNTECRCFIIEQRIINFGADRGKVDVETYFPGDGDAPGGLTQKRVNDIRREETQIRSWKYRYIAACLKLIVDSETHHLRPRRRDE